MNLTIIKLLAVYLAYLKSCKSIKSENPVSAKTKIKSGFGGKLIIPKVNLNTMEEKIQLKISENLGLRDTMQLKDDIREIELLISNSNNIPLAKKEALLHQKEIKSKELDKLKYLGWEDDIIHSKLQEVTWDETAQFRDDRHDSKSTSIEIENFMLTLVNQAIAFGDKSKILDVGCGNAILLKYLQKHSKKIISKFFSEENYKGIDISNEMIKIAKKKYPIPEFFQGEFNTYSFSENENFNVIVFNECLHYFRDIPATLKKACSLCNDSSTNNEATIVISHPRGYDNVLLQYSKNRWLVPNLLPSPNDLTEIANSLGLKVKISPKTKDPHYLAVLTRNIDK